MNTCSQFEAIIKKLLADEISLPERDELLEHARQCKVCRELINLHEELEHPEFVLPEPENIPFQTMRSFVRQKVRRQSGPLPYFFPDFVSRIRVGFLRPLLVAATMIIMFVLGYAGHSLINIPSPTPEPTDPVGINHDAIKYLKMRDADNSPYLYQNVRLNEIDGEQLSLNFDVTMHVDMVCSLNDPLLKEVVTQSLYNQDPLSNRLQTIGFTEKILDPEIKKALVFTLHNDVHVAVRLKALTSLVNYQRDFHIQDALLKTLRNDPSTYIRMLVIDYLTGQVSNQDLRQKLEAELQYAKDVRVINKLKQVINQPSKERKVY
ncbi:zf-HC2 domain-containing protein [candidate division CSSED10-310 bacterium]|uniref:Zf-HC2 domain-containing protein n=1 Tax=candidate division CSSED10-310 bacterium TaxID=2855610 RepID=A0ABV6YT68_UNCC1